MDPTSLLGMLATIAGLLGNGPVNHMPTVVIAETSWLHDLCRVPCSAVYVAPVIYLSRDLDLTTTHDQGILFHELVHHYQEIKHRYSGYHECQRWNRREQEAYQLQNLWYKDNRTGHHVRGIMRNCP